MAKIENEHLHSFTATALPLVYSYLKDLVGYESYILDREGNWTKG